MATPSVPHEDERNRTILLCRSPQNAGDDACLTYEVKLALCDPAFADRFANPSQCSHMSSWSRPTSISRRKVTWADYSGSEADELWLRRQQKARFTFQASEPLQNSHCPL